MLSCTATLYFLWHLSAYLYKLGDRKVLNSFSNNRTTTNCCNHFYTWALIQIHSLDIEDNISTKQEINTIQGATKLHTDYWHLFNCIIELPSALFLRYCKQDKTTDLVRDSVCASEARISLTPSSWVKSSSDSKDY